LIAEDLSPDLGCYGNQQVRTPNLDRVASEGVRYTRMFTTSGVCSPSRTAIAVGCLQTSVGAFHMR
jgi:arylsulfatase A-like enzyme